MKTLLALLLITSAHQNSKLDLGVRQFFNAQDKLALQTFLELEKKETRLRTIFWHD